MKEFFNWLVFGFPLKNTEFFWTLEFDILAGNLFRNKPQNNSKSLKERLWKQNAYSD